MSFISETYNRNLAFESSTISRNIEENRKGNFTLCITLDGKSLDNAEISYDLVRHDFDFGCNIFMLDQHDSADDENTYRELWQKLFNTAVVPLYWEGTEPQRGKLRYSSDVANDVYRRPPVDTVVDFCKKSGISMKGHPLFWHEFVPKWLPESWDELLPLIEKRFCEISERYSADIPVFDLVNEPARIWDIIYEEKLSPHRKWILPPENYLDIVFELGKKYFPNNTLILNEAVSGSFCDFRGIYSGYYQLIEKCLEKEYKLDSIGLQCHVFDSPQFRNIFDAERLYGVLDIYGSLGKPLVLSEIGLSAENDEIQAMAAEMLYKVCFSHKSMGGIFWWNLDDNGVLCTKDRNAVGENLPSSGLIRNGVPKAAYKAISKLIKNEWVSNGTTKIENGRCDIDCFFGTYDAEISANGFCKKVQLKLLQCADRTVEIDL